MQANTASNCSARNCRERSGTQQNKCEHRPDRDKNFSSISSDQLLLERNLGETDCAVRGNFLEIKQIGRQGVEEHLPMLRPQADHKNEKTVREEGEIIKRKNATSPADVKAHQINTAVLFFFASQQSCDEIAAFRTKNVTLQAARLGSRQRLANSARSKTQRDADGPDAGRVQGCNGEIGILEKSLAILCETSPASVPRRFEISV